MTAALRVLNPSRSELVGGATLQRDAATPLGWVEAGAHAAVAALQHAAEQVEVHAARRDRPMGCGPRAGSRRCGAARGPQISGDQPVAVSQPVLGLPSPVTSSQPGVTVRLLSWSNVRTEYSRPAELSTLFA